MLRVRVVSPASLTGPLVERLTAAHGVHNLVVLRGAVRRPEGDAVHFDLSDGAANPVFRELRELGLARHGSVSVERVDATLTAAAPVAKTGVLRRETAPVWEMVEAVIRGGAIYAPSFYGLLTIAGLIGAVGILTNSQILIVGAMVVGPEYGAILSLAFGVTRRDSSRMLRSAAALAVGFTLAVIGALLLALIIRAAGLEPRAYALGVRPVSSLIDTPNWFSFIVALLAGVVGVVSLTEARSATLIGVFISVTTIPAASDTGVSLAFGNTSEAWGSVLQLLLNVTVLTAVAVAGLPVQRAIWQRATRRAAAGKNRRLMA
jgi:uncharacterized hydrophobic protein (TIGR00271 family)